MSWKIFVGIYRHNNPLCCTFTERVYAGLRVSTRIPVVDKRLSD